MENIFDLLPKYFTDSCNDNEKLEVELWITQSSENKKTFHELKEIWENSENVTDNILLNPKKAWYHIKQETGIHEKESLVIGLNSRYRNLLKIAATLIILIGIGAAVKITIFDKPGVLIASTLNSGKQEIHLADGSIVYLNQGSQIKYPEKFVLATREIELEGEAFFKVAKDKNHPFIVHANGTNTRVLGTSFNINTKNSERVTIAVFSGKVSFTSQKSSKQEIKLIKGESGVFNKSTASLTKQVGVNDNAIAWQTGILKFNKTRLDEATSVLSEYYSKAIEISPKLQNRTISVTFNNQPLSKAIEIIELTLGVKAVITSEKIMLYPIEN